MPARPSHIPTYFERLGLEATIKSRPIPGEVGPRTVIKMLAKGWIEPAGPNRKYRITEAGFDAMKRKIPSKG